MRTPYNAQGLQMNERLDQGSFHCTNVKVARTGTDVEGKQERECIGYTEGDEPSLSGDFCC